MLQADGPDFVVHLIGSKKVLAGSKPFKLLRSLPDQYCGCPILRMFCEGRVAQRPACRHFVCFSFSRCSFRFDLQRALDAGGVMEEAGPLPILGDVPLVRTRARKVRAPGGASFGARPKGERAEKRSRFRNKIPGVRPASGLAAVCGMSEFMP